jgi:hypothetical protein
VEDDVTLEPGGTETDPHRRRAGHLYGLIVTGAVLATAPEDIRPIRVALLVLSTLVIYWAAETYVHWIASRTHVRRPLSRNERRMIVRDGWPLVAACSVPLTFLAVEALLGVETSVAVDVTLALNAGLLFATGWQMGASSGLSGWRLAFASAIAGLLGVALIVFKSLLH